MKRILLLLTTVTLLFAGCKKDDVQTEQTIFLDLKDQDGKLITLKVENTSVFFFEDTGKAVDYSNSNPSLNDGKLTYTDGTFSSQAKIVDYGSAVYTFENVPNGQYILWVHYFPYSAGVRSAKKLVVNENSHLKKEVKIFKNTSGYEEW